MPDSWLQDLRFALRSLGRARLLAATSMLTLALGIGANTAIFSVVNGVLLRPLPYRDADAIVRVSEERSAPGGATFSVLTDRTLAAWAPESRALEDVGGYSDRTYTLTGRGDPERLRGATLSPAVFRILRAAPLHGRLFLPEEERPGASRVVVLGYSLFERRFDADPGIVGATLTLDGEPYTVVGVAERGFHFPAREAELWTPLVLDPPVPGASEVRIRAFSGIGRLAAGVTAEQAAAEGQTILDRLDGGTPGPLGAARAHVVPLQAEMVAEVRPALLALLAAVGLVLLIACANLANLLLARATARRREMAIRVAVGAGRGRLIRQLLVESLLLSLGGGGMGLGLASVLVPFLPRMVPTDVPRLEEIGVDGKVVLFASLATLATAALFGLWPAMRASRVDPTRDLHRGAAGGGGSFRLLRGNGGRSLLAIAEIALAVPLLAAATMTLSGFLDLVQREPGFDPANVLTTVLPESRGSRPPVEVWRELLERLESAPGVEAAGIVSSLPLSGREMKMLLGAPGHPASTRPEDMISARPQAVSAGYLEAMGLSLEEGRWIEPTDDERAAPVVVVNRELERRYFPAGAISEHLAVGPGTPAEIVGVVGDVRHEGYEGEISPEIYLPYLQAPPLAAHAALAIRATGDPLALVPMLRELVLDVDPNLPLDNVMTMSARLSQSVAEPRFFVLLLGAFSAIALLIATIGIYGILSYTVSQQRRDLGLRQALGAGRSEIVGLVVRQGLSLTAAGVVLGLLGAGALSQALEASLFGLGTADPKAWMTIPPVLALVALLACWLPARRALRVDPMVVLRDE